MLASDLPFEGMNGEQIMKNRMITLLSLLALGFLLVGAPVRKAIAQISSSYFLWGVNDDSSEADGDQGGAIELGSPSGVGQNPIASGQPYIDFHYGNGLAQDYNYRISNAGDKVLSFSNATGNTPLQLESADVKVNNGVDPTGSGLKHARNSGCSTTGGVSNCNITLAWPGTAFANTNYTVTCTFLAGKLFSITSKGTSSLSIFVTAGLNQASGEVDCIAVHD